MYEQGKRLEVMKERCKMSSRVVSIIQIFTIVGVVLSFVGAVICFTQRNMINEQLAEAVRSGRVTVESIRIGGMLHFMIDYTKAFEAGSFAVPMAVSCITGAVICLIITVVLSMFKNIFNSLVKEDTPFSDYILGRLKVCFIIITMADRKMSLNELSEHVGVSNVNLSKIKTGKISAIRFSTLEAICETLHCQPGDILEYDPDAEKEK